MKAKALITMCALVVGLGVASLSAQPSAASTASATSNLLGPGDRLLPGDSATSDDGRFMLLYQDDGNLVLYGPGGPMWASNTFGAPGEAVLQLDGNFVIYDADGNAEWASNTAGSAGSFMYVQSDGNVVIYDSGGSPLWWTGTAGL